MARIGMINPVYAKITNETEGSPITYGTGARCGKAIAASLTINRRDNKLYADDNVAETDKGITDYTIDFEADAISHDARVDLVGEEKLTDGSTEVYSVSEDEGAYVGFGYMRKMKENGAIKYEARWYHKVKFATTTEEDSTKGESITWGTAKLNGTGVGVIIDQTRKLRYYEDAPASTEAECWAWLKAKANIA